MSILLFTDFDQIFMFMIQNSNFLQIYSIMQDIYPDLLKLLLYVWNVT